MFCLNPLYYLVKMPWLGRRLAYWVRTHGFEYLQLHVPLGQGLGCPIDHYEAFYSFSEIFVERAYAALEEYIPLPQRWIDVGSHRGFFSLYCCWRRKQQGQLEGVQACLIDADPRALTWTRSLVEANFLLPHLQFMHGAVAAPTQGAYVPFALCEGMLSSLTGQWARVQEWVEVPRLTPDKVKGFFPGPYDLIKIDIEGAEGLFFEQFECLLPQTKALLVEWHDAQPGLAVQGALVARCRDWGFDHFAQIQPERSISENGVYCGTVLFWR